MIASNNNYLISLFLKLISIDYGRIFMLTSFLADNCHSFYLYLLIGFYAEFSCQWKRKAGQMLLFSRHVAFYARSFGISSKETISYVCQLQYIKQLITHALSIAGVQMNATI